LNEAVRLDLDAFQSFAEQQQDVRFLFVNDGSDDDTLAVLEVLHESNPDQFLVLDLKRNVGKAEAVRQGMLYALGQATNAKMTTAKMGQAPNVIFGASPIFARPAFVGYWDADLATPLEAIVEFRDVLRLRPEIELLMGARVQLAGRSIQRHGMRHYLGRCFATAASWTLGMNVYDTQCGAKLFRVTESTAELFAMPFRSRWIFDVEILARMLARRGSRDETGRGNLLIVELKQWESARRTDMDGLVRTRFAEGEANTSHPSYQSWSYAELLRGFNETVDQDQVPLQPCAYLHNCQEGGDLLHPFYAHYVKLAPVFLGGDEERIHARSCSRLRPRKQGGNRISRW